MGIEVFWSSAGQRWLLNNIMSVRVTECENLLCRATDKKCNVKVKKKKKKVVSVNDLHIDWDCSSIIYNTFKISAGLLEHKRRFLPADTLSACLIHRAG